GIAGSDELEIGSETIDTYWDLVRVREYHDPEPFVTFGAQEELPDATSIMIDSPNATLIYNTTVVLLEGSINGTVTGAVYSINGEANISLTIFDGLVYQETPDSNVCSGDWNASFPCTNVFDGDWDTYGKSKDFNVTQQVGGATLNYTKPYNAVNVFAIYKYDGGIPNITIPETCYNLSEDHIQLIYSSWSVNAVTTSTRLDCRNATGDIIILDGTSGWLLYEEAVYWNSTNIFRTTMAANLGSNNVIVCANITGKGLECETITFTVNASSPFVNITTP
ncbi:unnamed protein product, partial [marine sediment metagenome]